MEQKSTCKECKEFLIKQYVDENNKSIGKYDDTKDNKMPFGKHKDKSLTDLTKRQIAAYLEQRQRGLYTKTKYPELYCLLHKYATYKWPDWSETLSLLCQCRRKKIWSCPKHGVL